MGKLDELIKAGGSNVAESMGAGRAAEPPPGMDPTMARRMPARLEGVSRDKEAARISIDRIVRDPRQPREEFDEESLHRLADSLRQRGQLQPIRVRWDETQGKYVILVGERRWRAAQMAGLTSLSCIIVEGELGDAERLSIQLVENALREDLKPVEQARAYKTLMETHGWSGNQLAKELHIAQASVVKALALLDLPEQVQNQIDRGELAASVAYEVSKLDDPEQQRELASAAVAEKLTRSEVVEAVKAVRARRPVPEARPEPVEVEVEPGVTVVVRYRKPSSLTAVHALRKALKILQERDRTSDQAA
jgi:ParB family transcriptional regulator, chromosome partitioning protein